jgi:AraC-like DNA-binding protein
MTATSLGAESATTPVESFTTEGLEPGRRLEYWNEVACRNFAPLICDPADVGSFSASLSRIEIGGLRVSEVITDATTIRHTSEHVALTSADTYFLFLQLEGTSVNAQAGRDASLSPGDFALCGTWLPYELLLPSGGRRLVIGIGEELLRRHVTDPDNLVAMRVPGNRGMSRLLSDFVRSLWDCRHDAMEPSVAPRMAETVLDLVAATFSASPNGQSERASLAPAHRARIQAYIESHLRDAQLNPSRIAQACQISPRYLHHLFAGREETVTQYITRRRLEECALMLSQGHTPGRQLTDIAFYYGFSSLTHFGRVFRSHYGVTPSEYRRSARN